MAATIAIATFYRFTPVADVPALRAELRERCELLALKGTILVAPEGINSTLSGTGDAITELRAWFDRQPAFADMPWKISWHDRQPFGHMWVKAKREIVTIGLPELPIIGNTGTYVPPEQWDELIARDDVVLVDTRNDYECEAGTFAGAIDPGLACFRDFPAWVEANLDPERDEHVAMYCTGGIRCEKATALLRERGFKHVYHLEGGILAYLEHTGNASRQWQGNCFVFDERVAVDPELRATGE